MVFQTNISAKNAFQRGKTDNIEGLFGQIRIGLFKIESTQKLDTDRILGSTYKHAQKTANCYQQSAESAV